MITTNFLPQDAQAILAIPLPQNQVSDRLVWSNYSKRVYSAKDGYRYWRLHNADLDDIPQSQGWGKIWKLNVPHKVKIFVWRFCRNTISVRSRLSTKGISVPITCPMCSNDVEHLLHVFFDCTFSTQCWNHVGLCYDMHLIEYAPTWLLNKISETNTEEANKVCIVLWGIWN